MEDVDTKYEDAKVEVELPEDTFNLYIRLNIDYCVVP